MTNKTTPGPPTHDDSKFKDHLRDLLHTAGLSVDEVVPMFEVSRVSIYTWMNDHGPQQPLIRSRALRVITLIEKVVAFKDLPLVEVQKKDRPRALSAVFKKHLAPPPKAAPRAED
jgi:hypothetical protein